MNSRNGLNSSISVRNSTAFQLYQVKFTVWSHNLLIWQNRTRGCAAVAWSGIAMGLVPATTAWSQLCHWQVATLDKYLLLPTGWSTPPHSYGTARALTSNLTCCIHKLSYVQAFYLSREAAEKAKRNNALNHVPVDYKSFSHRSGLEYRNSRNILSSCFILVFSQEFTGVSCGSFSVLPVWELSQDHSRDLVSSYSGFLSLRRARPEGISRQC